MTATPGSPVLTSFSAVAWVGINAGAFVMAFVAMQACFCRSMSGLFELKKGLMMELRGWVYVERVGLKISMQGEASKL